MIPWLRRFFTDRLSTIVEPLKPGPTFWRGAMVGLACALGVFIAMTAYAQIAPPKSSLGTFLAVIKLLAQMALFALAVLASVRLMQRMPSGYVWLLAASLAFVYYLFGRFEPWGVFWIAVAVVVPASILGGSLAALSQKAEPSTTPGTRWRAGVGLVAGAGSLVVLLFFFVRAGVREEPPINASELSERRITQLELPNPANRGDFAVRRLEYGSGQDRHREEFGEKTALVTEPVDGSAFIEGWDEWSGWARTQYWGFDAEALPLQGRVWYPEGEGPHPLVLVVHGNHAMEDFSDPGYAYLGELLASRGIITVSVDENFINSSFSGRLNGLRGRGLKTENDARGWLLLEHLAQWRRWNEEPGNPFHRKVDMERLGLIGHSRGGEAVAVAATFNRLPHYPDDASVRFDYGFAIQGIAAIAPSTGSTCRPAEAARLPILATS